MLARGGDTSVIVALVYTVSADTLRVGYIHEIF